LYTTLQTRETLSLRAALFLKRSIGNPPYNANQESENDNNRNRGYKAVDSLIKNTYVRYSGAQKSKVYDMYSRFFRWATNRLDDNGIVVFITNSSFIRTGTFDGFRKAVSNEFSEIYVIDLGGNVRAGDKSGNVFNIMLGVAISFMIKKENPSSPCNIFYHELSGFQNAEQKLKFLSSSKFSSIQFSHIIPDKYGNWVDQSKNNFDDFLQICNKGAKFDDGEFPENRLFRVYSNGISTNRDEWVYDFDRENLFAKMQFFIDEYNHEVDRWTKYKQEEKVADVKTEFNSVLDKMLSERNLIKWSKMIKRDKLRKNKKGVVNKDNIVKSAWRPFVKQFLYFEYIPIDIMGQQAELFPNSQYENIAIWFKTGTELPTFALAVDCIPNLLTQGGSQCFPLYRYDKDGDRIDNITDWGLTQFQTHYSDRTITKENILHYTYAVLHHPAYRTKYELNLKREFPRLPFYADFHQWATWGKALMELHLNYEAIEPYGLTRQDIASKDNPKAKLKADKTQGIITLDENTQLTGVPAIAWDYKLGNRSALEWILDQYKEKKPKDPTIAKLFNTYKFADYKEHVIDLLQRVCTVSVKTMEIIQQMPDTIEHEG